MSFIENILTGSNHPCQGRITFDSSDHVRFEGGVDVSGHNLYCHRRIMVENDIEGGEGYTVTIYNLDGVHPFWHNNVQMSPKRMRIIKVEGNVVSFRGYGEDALGNSFADYGIIMQFDNETIKRAQLNMYDRNISIVYLK